MEYFKYLPTIEYANNEAINILARAKIRDYLKKNTYIYQPYIVKDFDRPDTLANTYYGHFKYAWLIFYANDMYDPVKDWVLDNRMFYEFLNHRYQEVQYTPGIYQVESTKVQFNSTLYQCTESYLSDAVISGYRYSDNKFKRLKGYWDYSNHGYYQSVPLSFPFYGFFYSTYLPDQGEYLQIIDSTGTELTVAEALPPGTDAVIVMNNTKWTVNDLHTVNAGVLRPGYQVANETIKEYRNDDDLVVDESTPGNKRAVTYFEYEDVANEARRNIKLIDVRYVSQILQEFKKLFS